MAIWRLKSCPRCRRGDLCIERDDASWYAWCLQCGYAGDPLSIFKSDHPAADKEKDRPSISLRDLSAPSTEDYPPDTAPDYEIDITTNATSKV